MPSIHNPIKLCVIAMVLSVSCSEKYSREAVVWSKQTQVFHDPSCEWAQKISKSNLRKFQNSREALDAGLRPCNVCRDLILGVPALTGFAEDGEPEPHIRKFDSLNK
jgi:hypothetical protein